MNPLCTDHGIVDGARAHMFLGKGSWLAMFITRQARAEACPSLALLDSDPNIHVWAQPTQN